MTVIFTVLFCALFATFSIRNAYRKRYWRSAVYASAIVLLIGCVINDNLTKAIGIDLVMFCVMFGTVSRVGRKLRDRKKKPTLLYKRAIDKASTEA